MERATGKAPRRRPGLSLRGSMLLVLTLALWLGWQARLARQQREAVAVIREYGAYVRYDWESVGGKPVPGAGPKAPGWLRRAIGDDYFQEVVEVDFVYADRRGKPILTTRETDAVAAKLAAFPRLRHLDITDPLATDRAMDIIGRLTELETLRLWQPKISETGLAKVRGLRKLKVLQVDDAGLGDDALAHLAPLVRLKHLDLGGNPITNAGMAHLKGLKSLEFLDIGHSKVTDAGLDELRVLVNLKEVWVPDRIVSDDRIQRFYEEMPNLHTVR